MSEFDERLVPRAGGVGKSAVPDVDRAGSDASTDVRAMARPGFVGPRPYEWQYGGDIYGEPAPDVLEEARSRVQKVRAGNVISARRDLERGAIHVPQSEPSVQRPVVGSESQYDWQQQMGWSTAVENYPRAVTGNEVSGNEPKTDEDREAVAKLAARRSNLARYVGGVPPWVKAQRRAEESTAQTKTARDVASWILRTQQHSEWQPGVGGAGGGANRRWDRLQQSWMGALLTGNLGNRRKQQNYRRQKVQQAFASGRSSWIADSAYGRRKWAKLERSSRR